MWPTPMPHHNHDLLTVLLRHGNRSVPSSQQTWLWFFDFDGTLVDLAPHPDAVKLLPDLTDDLIRLATAPLQTVAIVSGRPLRDLTRHLPSHPALWLAGDHGAEVRGPQSFVWRHPSQETIEDEANTVALDLHTRVKDLPGVWVEAKATSMSIHYRQAPQAAIVNLNRILREYCWGSTWVLKPGQLCYEVRATNGPTKADAVRVIRGAVDPQGTSLCLAWGDDVTDEDMFLALPTGLTVKVGTDAAFPTSARFRVESVATVREIIHQMARYWTQS